MRPTTFLISFFSVLETQPVHAFWRLACSISQTARIDPILNPGAISGHVHKFAGGNNVNSNSDHDSLFASSCSTCQVQSDKSAYWTPQLYYQHGNGSFEEVQNDGMTVYYVGRGGDASNTKPFPPGFKMITGNSLLRHYDSSTLTYQDTRPVADRVSFRCIDEANDIPETHFLDKTDCVNGLRAQINFQSCWDGVNPYLSDQSHVAYLSGIDYGSCPPTHPVPIPGLFFEVLYWSNRIDQTDGGRFVFANGDTTGYGFHGDFLNGWDQNVQAQAVEQCLYADNNGVVESCAPLQSSNDVNFARSCPESGSVLQEAVRGLLPTDGLPGCNPITSGPADVKQMVCALNSTEPLGNLSVPVISTSVAATVLPSPVSPGGFFTSSIATLPTVISTSTAQSNLSVSSSIVLTSIPTSQQNISVSSSVSETESAVQTGSKVVTIAVPDFTTIAIEIPASLNPDTSYSDLAEATSYIDALISLASAEANNQTTAVFATSTPTTAAESDVFDVTVTQLVTITLPGSVRPTVPPGQTSPSVGPSNSSSGGNITFATGTRTTFVTVFNPTVTLKITSTAEVTVTGTPLSSRMLAKGLGFLRRKWQA